MKNNKEIRECDKYLEPFSSVIQKCPICGQLDVYRGDNHRCDVGYQNAVRENRDMYWNNN
jgi:predicted RNA-binding Zn-ribbon protein involved in translation (DUF1610 family)